MTAVTLPFHPHGPSSYLPRGCPVASEQSVTTGWPKTTPVYSVTAVEAGSLKAGCGRAAPPLRGGRPARLGGWWPLTAVSASVTTWPALLPVSLPLSLVGTLVIRFRATLVQDNLISRFLITSVNTVLP